MMRAMLVAILASASPVSVVAQAAPSDPSTPRPNHERLAFLEGAWRHLTPAGMPTATEQCAWLAGGRRHMSCTTRFETPRGVVEDRKIFSYRGRDSSYVINAFLPTGQVWTYVGRANGTNWTFDLQSDRLNDSLRLRVLLALSGDTLRVVEQASQNGGAWQISEDNRQVRVRRAP